MAGFFMADGLELVAQADHINERVYVHIDFHLVAKDVRGAGGFDVDIAQLRQKSLALADCFQQLLSQHDCLQVLQRITPYNEAERGSQLAYRHPQAYALCQALIKQGVIADFRAPDILRLGFTPLYLRYIDIWTAVEILADVVRSGEYLKAEYQVKQKVT